ncbi:Stringent starvation protein A [Wohlfahrtiimonas chitiniclastica]|uniref:glutathione binding-like protein n=1 Tax=Wohlfahrtiimonas chitiniclastica TaxID=400946 RepID=UPI000B982346|nr:glutathione binding-like protein [Wohlfahrtiimonas chitiniclastica]OYQ89501.1 Stringent starvation protein A [Wohlfahrtiimonas chitiniclastica]
MSTRRSGFTLYQENPSLDADRIAITLLEKNILSDSVYVDISNPPEELLDINPQLILPTLETKEVTLYYPGIVLEFLDERFPHPPLLPHDPINRGKFRLILKRVLNEWYSLLEKVLKKGEADKKSMKAIHDLLLRYNPLFEGFIYFQSNDFSIIDASLAPFFWHLQAFDIAIPEKAPAIIEYNSNILARESVIHHYKSKG